MFSIKIKFFKIMRGLFTHVWPSPDAYMYWDRKITNAQEGYTHGTS